MICKIMGRRTGINSALKSSGGSSKSRRNKTTNALVDLSLLPFSLLGTALGVTPKKHRHKK